MKKLILLIVIAITTSGCSNSDDPFEQYPQTHDITFDVSSSENRQSSIDFQILGGDIEKEFHSFSDDHLPLSRIYRNQKVNYQTGLLITYRDVSNVQVGVDFEPYTVTLTIRVDSEIVATNEFIVDESGLVDYVEYKFL
tara:strand:- start:57 stop:473 length:417 start_codon:yes stop_codon:yes gene_type:complete